MGQSLGCWHLKLHTRVVQNYTFFGKAKLIRADMVSRFLNTAVVKYCRNRSWLRVCEKHLKISEMALQSPMLIIFSNVTDPFDLAFFSCKIKFYGEFAL